MAEGHLDEAELYYERALELEPAHPAPYYNLACFYSITGKLDEALLHLSYAIRLDPSYRIDADRDEDLDPLRDLPEFQELVYPEEVG
jgi:tetratricopeptide (TPR) repeat protein